MLGRLLAEIWSYCREYVEATNREGVYFNRCMILLLSNLLPRCVDNMTTVVVEQQLEAEIKDKFFESMMEAWRRRREPVTAVSFVEEGVHFLYQLMIGADPSSLEWVLELFAKWIKVLKRNMGRADFKTTTLHEYLFDYLSKLHRNTANGQQARWHRQLFHALASLTLDDVQDAYRSNVRALMNELLGSIAQQHFLQVLYALTGILEAIDNEIIYRHFLGELCKIDVGHLVKCFFGVATNDEVFGKVLRVTRLLIADQHGRLQGKRSVYRLYAIIEKLIPIWGNALAQSQGEQPDIFEEFIEIIHAIFSEGIFNLCLLTAECQGFNIFLQRLFGKA